MAELATGVALMGVLGSTVSNVSATKANASGLELEAQNAEANAAFDERQQRRLSALDRGKAIAVGAASGVSISSGSPLLMELDRAKQAEIDALNIRRAGTMEATTKRYGAKVLRAGIPGMIFGGVAQGGSILSQYAARGKY